MMSTSPSKLANNRFIAILAGSYALLWTLLAIHPIDRGDWFLENLLVFAGVAVLIFTYRRFQFSNLTYVLIALFLALHAVGAHYTYAKVPAGFWMEDWLHLNRNHFDRVIHFSFGILFVYPLQELFTRAAGARATWVPWLALATITASSSFFEILEAIIAQIVHPDLGVAYLGTQGDIWDAQKDMVAAILGGIVGTIAIRLGLGGRTETVVRLNCVDPK
jgi:putative membrane protein